MQLEQAHSKNLIKALLRNLNSEQKLEVKMYFKNIYIILYSRPPGFNSYSNIFWVQFELKHIKKYNTVFFRKHVSNSKVKSAFHFCK